MSGKTKTSKLPKSAMSRLTNGTRILADADGRSAPARRQRDVYRMLRESDRHIWTTAKDEIARRAAGLVVYSERQESLMVTGDTAFDPDNYLRATNTLRRLLVDLGGITVPSPDDDDTTLDAYLGTALALRQHARTRLEDDDEE